VGRQHAQKRTRAFAGSLGIAILALLGLGFTYAKSEPTTPVEPVALSGDEVRLPLASLGEGELHRYSVDLPGGNGHPVRFIAMRLGDGDVVAAFDACVICGAKGYSQEGGEVLCQHCSSAIFPPTIGRPGGCNPIPLEFSVEGDEVVVAASALGEAADLFAGEGGSHAHAGGGH
jgi:uncharacterized membrane protein